MFACWMWGAAVCCGLGLRISWLVSAAAALRYVFSFSLGFLAVLVCFMCLGGIRWLHIRQKKRELYRRYGKLLMKNAGWMDDDEDDIPPDLQSEEAVNVADTEDAGGSVAASSEIGAASEQRVSDDEWENTDEGADEVVLEGDEASPSGFVGVISDFTSAIAGGADGGDPRTSQPTRMVDIESQFQSQSRLPQEEEPGPVAVGRRKSKKGKRPKIEQEVDD
eukprot:GHVT01013144.1.p1 GENE.GHVT01013144.1~~GHVT01013144.1.p1  ORF type:complete len:221 (+),score=45.61 GHVT01013144.1:225-887(+)